MAGNIKGITIEIGGDTTKLDKALKNVNNSTKDVNGELKQVNNLLKFNPGNAEMIAQKQELLAKQVSNTSDKLKILKESQAQVEAQFKSGDLGEEEYRAFQRELVATESKLKTYQGQLTASKNAQAELESSTNKLNAYFEASGKSVDDFSDVLGTKLTTAIKEGKASSSQLNEAINKIGRTVTDNSADFDKFTNSLKQIDDGGSIEQLKTELQQLGNEGQQTGDKLEDIGKKLDVNNLLQGADAIGGISDKASELVGDATEAAMSLGDFEAQAQRAFGLSKSEAESLGQVVQTVMEDGIVPSVEDAGEAVMATKNYFGDLNDVDLANVTTKIAAMSKTFDIDFKEAAMGASDLMNNFKISSNEAFDIMTAGFQQGLNNSDDFIDTIHEYSPLMQSAGLSATDFTNILAKGMQNGAMNTDKVADAVKEFQIRLGDGSFEENMGNFSKGTQNLFKDWKKGKATVKDVMDSVGKDLKKMDPAEQQKALSALSSQFEDLGIKTSVALFETEGGLKKVGGAADDLNKKSPGEKLAGSLAELKNSVADAIQPLIEKLGELVGWFNKLPGPAKQIIGVVAGITTVVLALTPVVLGAAAAISTLTISAGPIIAIIGAVIAVIAALVLAIMNWGKIVDWLKGVWSGISEWFGELWTNVQQVFTDSIQAISEWFTTAWDGIKQTTENVWNGIKEFFSLVWDGIKLVFQTVLEAIAAYIKFEIEGWKLIITTTMNIIKAVFKAVWEGIKTAISATINAIKVTITTVWNAIKTATSVTWNAIKTAVSVVINVIKTVITTVFNAIKSVVTGVWEYLKGATSRTWNSLKNVITKVVNGIKSVVTSVFNGVKSTVTTIWNGIKSAIEKPMNAAKNLVKKAIDAIKGFFNFKVTWPHIPLPHFKAHGSANPIDWIKGKGIPSIGIDWYAKGGIMTKPTMFANNGGNLSVGGEAGPEGVIPLNKETLAQIGAGIAEANGSTGQTVINLTVYGDLSDATARRWADKIAVAINQARSRKNIVGGA